MKKIIYSALYQDDCFPFHALGDDIDVANEAKDLRQLDSMLVVWGGTDIHPSYYGHPVHPRTYPGAPMRDKREWELMLAAKEKGIPIIGVCRGAQMLCALAGGWLIQDIRNHGNGGKHFVKTFDNKVLLTNSLHHQMMAGLDGVNHELVAWTLDSAIRVPEYFYKNDQKYEPPTGFREPEMVYFPDVKGYAIQWHPEMMAQDAEATKFVLEYITKKEEANARSYSQVTV